MSGEQGIRREVVLMMMAGTAVEEAGLEDERWWQKDHSESWWQ